MSKKNSPEAKRRRRAEREKRKAAFQGEGYVNKHGLLQKWQPPRGMSNYAMRRIKEKKGRKDAKFLRAHEEEEAIG